MNFFMSQKLGKVVVVTGHACKRTTQRDVSFRDIELALLAGRKGPGRGRSVKHQYGKVTSYCETLCKEDYRHHGVQRFSRLTSFTPCGCGVRIDLDSGAGASVARW
jgi:hypothetical protein